MTTTALDFENLVPSVSLRISLLSKVDSSGHSAVYAGLGRLLAGPTQVAGTKDHCEAQRDIIV